MKSTQADQLARVGGWMKTIHFGLTVSMSHPSVDWSYAGGCGMPDKGLWLVIVGGMKALDSD